MRIGKKFYIGVASLIVAVGALVALNVTNTGIFASNNQNPCTADQIIRCGVTSEKDLLNKYDRNVQNVQQVFKHYGITRADLAGQNGVTIERATVYRDGRVVVKGKTVATGAHSVSRIAYSSIDTGKRPTPVNIGGTTYYQGPDLGTFKKGINSHTAYVYMKNGQYHKAVLDDCANPIIATPVPQPVYSCDDLTVKRIERNKFEFTSAATVKNGARIINYNYDFGDGNKLNGAGKTVTHTYNTDVAKSYTVKMTVNVSVDGKTITVPGANCNVTVAVTAKPKPATYQCESFTAKKINRTTYEFTVKASASNARIISYNYDFGNGKKATTTKTTVSHNYGNNPGSYTATVTVNVDINGRTVVTNVGGCKVTVKVEEEPKVPVFKCESLKATKIDRTEFRFNATASAEHATIKSYTFNFGDGKSKTITTGAKTATATHQYSGEARSYTAEVIVTMSDGKTAPRVQACKTTVKVEKEKIPSISIEKTVNNKKHDKVEVGEEFTYEITVRNTGDVVLKDAVVTDNAPAEVTLLSADAGKIDGNKWTHTIPQLEIGDVKKFIIKAEYTKYSSGTHKNTVCVDTPTVTGSPDDCDDATTETDQPIEVCDLNDNSIKTIKRSEFDESHMTTDLSQCEDIEVCIIEDKTIKTIKKNEFDESTMTTDLSKCEEVETPPELPQTGIDPFISGGLGLGSITAASYYWVASRRNLLDALLNK